MLCITEAAALLYLYWCVSGELEKLLSVEPDLPHNVFNDAKCDHVGRLWCGTMDEGPLMRPDFPRSKGTLYSFDGGKPFRYYLALLLYMHCVNQSNLIIFVW